MFRDPQKIRSAGYISLALSLGGFCCCAYALATVEEGTLPRELLLCLLLSATAFVMALLWMRRWIRCPRCGACLDLRPVDISVCPYCGSSTDPDHDRKV